jgi:hypothetical protein
MKRPVIYLCLALCLLLGAVKASGQAEAQVSEMETLNGGGSLAIQITCDAYGSWDDGNTQTFDLPVTVSGTWDYWASFWIWMLECGTNSEDCQGYSYARRGMAGHWLQ